MFRRECEISQRRKRKRKEFTVSSETIALGTRQGKKSDLQSQTSDMQTVKLHHRFNSSVETIGHRPENPDARHLHMLNIPGANIKADLPSYSSLS